MTDFTAGPWHLGSLPPTGWRYILASDSSEIAAVADWQENGDLHMEFGPNAHANARLIATAPDILEALEDLVAIYGTKFHQVLAISDKYDTAIDTARAAIAKAHGK